MSIHIAANPGDIAETILLPGDPLRAKHIAETYLEDAVCYNEVRGMLGFTGSYQGKRVSVQGTGMGVPSINPKSPWSAPKVVRNVFEAGLHHPTRYISQLPPKNSLISSPRLSTTSSQCFQGNSSMATFGMTMCSSEAVMLCSSWISILWVSVPASMTWR